MRRVVVTGMGLVSPLGCGVELVWQRLLAGRSGLSRLPDAVTDGIAAKVAGQVPDVAQDPEGGWDVDAIVSSKDQRKMDRFIPFALGAAQQALAQAGWPPADERARERTATVIASGIGGFGAIAEAVRTTDTRGPQRLSPFTVPSFLVNLAAGQVSIRHGLKGPLGAPVTACAASVQVSSLSWPGSTPASSNSIRRALCETIWAFEPLPMVTQTVRPAMSGQSFTDSALGPTIVVSD